MVELLVEPELPPDEPLPLDELLPEELELLSVLEEPELLVVLEVVDELASLELSAELDCSDEVVLELSLELSLELGVSDELEPGVSEEVLLDGLEVVSSLEVFPVPEGRLDVSPELLGLLEGILLVPSFEDVPDDEPTL